VVTGGWVVSVIDGVVGAAVGSVVSKAAVVSGSSVGTAASVPCVVSVQKNDCF